MVASARFQHAGQNILSPLKIDIDHAFAARRETLSHGHVTARIKSKIGLSQAVPKPALWITDCPLLAEDDR